jgi:hypothetical protein
MHHFTKCTREDVTGRRLDWRTGRLGLQMQSSFSRGIFTRGIEVKLNLNVDSPGTWDTQNSKIIPSLLSKAGP